MDYISCCPLCRGKDFKREAVIDGEIYVGCRQCGLVFVNPRQGSGSVKDQYTQNVSSTADYYAQTAGQDEMTHMGRLELIERHTRRGQLLDVGCNVGAFMDAAKKKGWEVFGIEPNPKAAALCKSRHRHTVNGFFEQAPFHPGAAESFPDRFDLVAMTDVLEHFPDPAGALEKARGCLKDGGLVFIVTPNFSNTMTRRFHMKPREHLFLFRKNPLTRLLTDNGFDVLVCSGVSRYRNLRALEHSTTRLGKAMSALVQLACGLKIDNLLSELFFRVLKDELLVIARKKEEVRP